MADAFVDLDGMAQAQLVRQGSVTPAELLEAAIARADHVNPLLNAINYPMYEEGRSTAAGELPDGPFRGLPFLLKDLSSAYAGVPTSAGSRLFADVPAAHDSETVARLKRAGTVIFGKTNTPEFGSLGTTEPLLFLRTANPWNTAYSPGGSSGGSAAAVVARIVPVAHASDGAGSIRIPASACGIFGLKPTRGRLSSGPDTGEGPGGVSTEGVVSLSVRDSAAMLDVMSGPGLGDPYSAAPAVMPFLAATALPPGRLRIALTRRSMIGTTLHPDCVAAVDDAAHLCESLGHTVVEDAPALDAAEWNAAYRRFWPQLAARGMRRAVRMRGDEAAVLEAVEPINQYFYAESMKVAAPDYLADQLWFHATSRAFARWMHGGDGEPGYDLWLTPTLGLPPQLPEFFDARLHGGAAVLDRFIEFLPFTPFANMTGQPAMTVPLYWNQDGLPVGAHFFGRTGDEATLFRLAAQLEQARPWTEPQPSVRA